MRGLGVLISCLIAVALAWSAAPVALAASTGVELLGGAPPARRLQLVFPLKVDGAGLERFAQAVSTPGSPLYGQYESIPTLARRFGASSEARRRVIGYLRAHGASDVRMDATGLFADATMDAGLAERLVATPSLRFRADGGSRYIAPTTQGEIPKPLVGVVEGVVGLDTKPLINQAGSVVTGSAGRLSAHAAGQPSSELPRTGTPSGCAAGVGSGGFTPNQYLTAYDFDPLHQDGYLGQGERVAVIELDGVSDSDIATFAQCFGLPVPAIDTHLVGISQSPAPGRETTLDVDLLDAAAPDLSGIDVYESANDAAAFLQALTAPVQNRAEKPQVISISLGTCESLFGSDVGTRAIVAAEYALGEEIASGVTVLAATGDTGSTACQESPESAPLDMRAVNFPASSPYVTAVGGTNLSLTPANQIAEEAVWNDAPLAMGAGGGGFSELFQRAVWQRPPPVNVGVLQTANGPVPLRAVPDVAMLADGFPGYSIYCSTPDCAGTGSPWMRIGGTSVATPLLAGAVAIVDQAIRAHQRPGVGQLTPLLYYFGNSNDRNYIFHDVTVGSNDLGAYLPGSGGKPIGCCSATPGYDEASGWGSVDVTHLANLLAVALPNAHLHIAVTLPAHQHPVRSGRITWVVSCSTDCTISAGAVITIGRGRPYSVITSSQYLSSAGSRKFVLKFKRAELAKLRSALRKHSRISAVVYGDAFDPTYHITGVDFASKLASKRLKIAS